MKSTTPPSPCAAIATACAFLLADAGATRGESRPEPALLTAVRRGDLVLTESYLREGAPIGIRTTEGDTPLTLAALHAPPEVTALLLRFGADPNAVNKAGACALLYAVGDERKVRMLLDHGARVNVQTALGNTPLIAAASHVGNLGVIQLLLDKGADLHARNQNDVTALTAAVVAGDAAAVRYFLDRGCKPGPVKYMFNGAGNSMLQLAAQVGDEQIVELLLQRGAAVNESDSTFGGHALNFALLSENPKVALQLIHAGADLKKVSPIGRVPPLMLSVYSESGDASVVEAMLQRGVDAGGANRAGETALTWARRRGYPALTAPLVAASTPDRVDARPTPPSRPAPRDPDERRAMQRRAIEKSIAILQHSSDAFLEVRRSCVSCHHQNLPSVAMGWARDRGFAVDERSIQRIVDRSLSTWSKKEKAAYEMDRPFPAPPQLLGYGLWGLAAVGTPADKTTDATVWYLAETQKPDGHWEAGAIVRPPMGGDDVQSTALAMRSLQLYAPMGRRADAAARVDKARRWLAAAKATVHEERVYKMLGLAWAAAPTAEIAESAQALSAAQNSDGGWSQLPHLPSDAWATGQALVALQTAGRSFKSDPAVERGVDFLLRTQFDDGAWYVQSRSWPFQPIFDSKFPFGRDQWISVGGTAWATMALLLDIDASQTPAAPVQRTRRMTPDAAASTNPPKVQAAEPSKAPQTLRKSRPVDFAREVKPLLERSCAGCHTGETPQGGYRISQRDAFLLGGESGEPAVVSKKSGQSPLMARISAMDPDLAMPPLRERRRHPPISAAEREIIRAWIDEGVDWPGNASIQPKSP